MVKKLLTKEWEREREEWFVCVMCLSEVIYKEPSSLYQKSSTIQSLEGQMLDLLDFESQFNHLSDLHLYT